jgi:hypothetical protein
VRRIATIGLGVLLLSSCAMTPTPDVFVPGAAADYQLGGGYPSPPGVTVVARDSTEAPAAGAYSICYLNGFQTQPGSAWSDELVLHEGGEAIVDPEWPDENIIDIREPEAARVQYSAIDSCAADGFDAVEFDNLDSYTRSGGQLTLADATTFATLLVTRAHEVGLAAGQKNTIELGAIGRDEIGFDFAIVEECDQYRECDDIVAVYGDAVIDIEYTDELRRPFSEVCADASTPRSTILRDRDLLPLGSPGHVYERC